MKRLLLGLSLLFSACASTGALTTGTVSQVPACVLTLETAVVQDALTRLAAVMSSGFPTETIVANLESIARDVGPEAFLCAMDYFAYRTTP